MKRYYIVGSSGKVKQVMYQEYLRCLNEPNFTTYEVDGDTTTVSSMTEETEHDEFPANS